MMPDVRADRRDKAIGAGDALGLVLLSLSANLLDGVHILFGVADEPFTLVGGCVSLLIGGIIYALVS